MTVNFERNADQQYFFSSENDNEFVPNFSCTSLDYISDEKSSACFHPDVW